MQHIYLIQFIQTSKTTFYDFDFKIMDIIPWSGVAWLHKSPRMRSSETIPPKLPVNIFWALHSGIVPFAKFKEVCDQIDYMVWSWDTDFEVWPKIISGEWNNENRWSIRGYRFYWNGYVFGSRNRSKFERKYPYSQQQYQWECENGNDDDWIRKNGRYYKVV